MLKKSRRLFEEAKRCLVGGVNSPLRAFGAVGGRPLIIKEGQGSRVKDIEGREYIDYVGNFGALILGHAHPKVMATLRKAAARGNGFGTTTREEVELAKEICAAFPSVEKLRLVNSGTEAVMGALKLARAFTKRNKVIKFKKCYHGWSEQPYLEAEYNNLDSVRDLASKEVAAVILEPVAGNFGVVPPMPGFLEGLRKICDQTGAILIFDEVITGFRVAYGGAQELYGVRADLTCLGKIIGGGLPVGAFGGRAEIMEFLAPLGPVYQAGTFSGNSLTVAAGLGTLQILKSKKIYADIEAKAKALDEILRVTRVGSMFSFVREDYKSFFWKALRNGIYFAPSAKEANFISAAHTLKDIEETARKVR